MDFADLPDFALPLCAAVLAGGLIGFEREWRGRAAGFRTHILVCVASALLMELAVRQGDWRFEPLAGTEIVADPARMAHGVLTGIGFLCAGVIFRSGFSIHGLTTAASLWVTAGIGLVFGAGMWTLGAAGTGMTFLVLAGLRLVNMKVPQTAVIDASVTWPRATPELAARLDQVLRDAGLVAEADRFELRDEGRHVRRAFRLKRLASGQVRDLADRLLAVEGLIGFDLNPRDD